MNKKKRKNKGLWSILIFIIGLVLAAYVGGWLLFIKPIISCCIAFDAGTLTALIVGISVIKILCASVVAGVIIWVSGLISTIITAS